MTRDDLIALLLEDAYSEVRKYHCRFSPVADLQLRELVSSGVYRMSDDERNNDMKIAEARRNMRLLCQSLCVQTKQDNRMIVENKSFSRARMSICPLWPFC